MPEMPTGQLIRLYRIDRKKTTVNLATHVGITVRYLEMIEAGTKTPSLPVLRKLAKVLGVRTSALIGEAPSEDHEGPVNPGLAATERALYTYRSVSLAGRDTPPELLDLTQRTTAAWDTWLVSPNKYTDTLSVLPNLIVDAEHAVHAYDRSPEACRQASEVYQLARAVLKHGGRADLVPLVCDRAMRYAEETSDPLLIGAATWYVGQAVLSNDMPQAALDIAMTTAEKFEKLPNGTPEHFYVYGGLLQLGAIAAVRTGDPNARSMVSTLVKRAKPSYATEVREFAGQIGLLN
jgi:transcriptional regulator with XRE-family HTH domain